MIAILIMKKTRINAAYIYQIVRPHRIDITYLILSRTVFGKRYLFSEYPPPLIYDMKSRWVQIELNFLSNRLDILLLISSVAADSRKRRHFT
jgi:hypothetical protein